MQPYRYGAGRLQGGKKGAGIAYGFIAYRQTVGCSALGVD